MKLLAWNGYLICVQNLGFDSNPSILITLKIKARPLHGVVEVVEAMGRLPAFCRSLLQMMSFLLLPPLSWRVSASDPAPVELPSSDPSAPPVKWKILQKRFVLLKHNNDFDLFMHSAL